MAKNIQFKLKQMNQFGAVVESAKHKQITQDNLQVETVKLQMNTEKHEKMCLFCFSLALNNRLQ